MVATILTSTTQPLSDILPWGTPITVSSSSSADSSDTTSSNSRKYTTDERTLLVTDAIANDGRFILNTLALQYLSSRHTISSDDVNNNNSNTTKLEGAVLWISCSSTAEKEIMLGLRKGMQHNLAGVGSNNNGSGRIHTVSISIELADVALSSTEDQSSAESKAVSHEVYLKQLHKRIVHWLKYRELLSTTQQQEQTSKDSSPSKGPNLIVIDNATTLATMFGNRLASAFLSSVRSSLKKCSKISSSSDDTTQSSSTSSITTCTNLLAIRASSPDDGGLYQLDTDDSLKGEKLRSEYARLLRPWLGLGSGSTITDANQIDTNTLQIEEQSNYLSLDPQSIPSFVYTSGLYELVDCIVDISPLESGYARDVLGRLSFVTTWNGKGWWGIGNSSGNTNTKNKKDAVDGAHISLCINYRCDDSGVRVMRLRT